MTTATAPTPAPTPAPRLLTSPAAVALTTAPALWIIGWVVMRVDGHNGPGWGWTTAHSIWVLSFVLFAVGALGMHRLADAKHVASRAGSLTGVIMAVAGTVAMLVQMGLDLYVGLTTSTKGEMSDAYDPILGTTWVDLAFFQIGPALLFVGLLILGIVVAARGKAPVLTPVLVGVGITMMILGRTALPDGLRFVEGVGEVVMWLGLVAVVRHKPATNGTTGMTR
ncbi:hypothetical protein [Phytomonospora endophytica]|uniref:DUF4386 family protein n=1 Tax=Phytomonospora endophytica TaxID=714109 RepID=A0A841FHF0_9ACTN|nr:hypothetical protein [Phytomonospora endophytica]MBB6035294.1 hypothetical protein [Phytomonospora endophytica]GIG63957.1 hypothetical protein Pen01_02520 [Phytomonospora endophytica]